MAFNAIVMNSVHKKNYFNNLLYFIYILYNIQKRMEYAFNSRHIVIQVRDP